MFVTVRGSNPGYPHVFRAGRGWPVGQEVRVEVLDQDADPPLVKVTKTTDDGVKQIEIPDPRRIGRKSYQALVNDPRLSIREEAAVDMSISSAIVEEMKSQVAAATAREAEALASVAGLKAQAGQQAAAIEALTAKLDGQTAELEGAAASLVELTAAHEELTKERDALKVKLAEHEQLLAAVTAPPKTSEETKRKK